jgi:predicted transcriptional regulator
MNSNETDPHLTTKIVCEYVAHHKLATDQLLELITAVHQAIGQLGQPAEVEEVRTPAVSVRRSVQHDYVVCLDCGYRGKTLRRHINVRHGLNRDEYLRRWGLKSDHPLTAPAYSERRSAMSKALGFGRRPADRVAQAGTPLMMPTPIEAEAKPIPRRKAPSKSAAGGTNPDANAKARTRRARRVAPREKNASPTAET